MKEHTNSKLIIVLDSLPPWLQVSVYISLLVMFDDYQKVLYFDGFFLMIFFLMIECIL